MGRPPLPLGTHGTISFHGEPPKVRAKARFRDLDGITRVVTKWGKSKTDAKTALLETMRDRAGPVGTGVTRDTRLEAVAREWLREVDESERADSTKGLLRRSVTTKIIPGVGQLRVSEATVPVLDRAVSVVREQYGNGAARTYRQGLSGVLGVAVRHGAISSNPVRELTRAAGEKRAVTRALTADEVCAMLDALDGDDEAVTDDLPDLVRFMLGTGVRIGEALALRWSHVDLNGQTVTITATTTEAKGKGTYIREATKTRAGHRVLAIPGDLAVMLDRRTGTLYPENVHGLVFPTVLGRIRKRARTTTDLRRALDRAGYPWVSSHTFRKTVATRLDEAGLSARQIADQLGHERPSMTTDVYMGRQVVSSEAAQALATPRTTRESGS